MSQTFKILSFTLFITSLFLGCTTQSDSYNCSLNIDSDLSKENIKGNVKKIETLIYRG